MSSGFVTESEITEARKKRQEEWEKVRQPDQPLGNLCLERHNNNKRIYNNWRNRVGKLKIEFAII